AAIPLRMVEGVQENALYVDMDSLENRQVLGCGKIEVVPLRTIDVRQVSFDTRSRIGHKIRRICGAGALELRIDKVHIRVMGPGASDMHRLLEIMCRGCADEVDPAIRSWVDGGGEAAREEDWRATLIECDDSRRPS